MDFPKRPPRQLIRRPKGNHTFEPGQGMDGRLGEKLSTDAVQAPQVLAQTLPKVSQGEIQVAMC